MLFPAQVRYGRITFGGINIEATAIIKYYSILLLIHRAGITDPGSNILDGKGGISKQPEFEDLNTKGITGKVGLFLLALFICITVTNNANKTLQSNSGWMQFYEYRLWGHIKVPVSTT